MVSTIQCRAANERGVALLRGIICVTSCVSTSEGCPKMRHVHRGTCQDLSRTVLRKLRFAIVRGMGGNFPVRRSDIGTCGFVTVSCREGGL